MRLISAVALAAVLVACSPAKQEAAAPSQAPVVAIDVSTVDPATRTGVLDALSTAIAEDLGQQVDFRVDQLKAEGDWAWVVVLPQALGGSPMDFSTTKYAAQAKEGALDGGGVTYALLERKNGAWTVRDFVVGPTDVAYLDWPDRYGAPAWIMGLAEKKTPPAVASAAARPTPAAPAPTQTP